MPKHAATKFKPANESDTGGAFDVTDIEYSFRRLAENIQDAFWICNPDFSKIYYLSPAYEQIWGRSRSQLYDDPQSWRAAIHPEDLARIETDMSTFWSKGLPSSLEHRIVRPDGSVRWIMNRAFPILDETGQWIRVAGVARDITERKEQEEKIRALSCLYAVLSGINSMIVRTRDRRVLFAEACRIAVTGGDFSSVWIGTLDADTLEGEVAAWHAAPDVPTGWISHIKVSVRPDAASARRIACIALRTGTAVICNDVAADPAFATQCEEITGNGDRAVAAMPIIVGGKTVAVMVLNARRPMHFDEAIVSLLHEMAGDLAFGLDHIAKEEQLAYMAVYDVLTGLPNSALFMDRLEQLLHAARAEKHMAAVLLLDLEHFKQINDSAGRHIGDGVLRQVAARLTAALPRGCCLARVGADSFAIAISSIKDGDDAAILLNEGVRVALNEPIVIEEHEIAIGFRAGIALFPGDSDGAAALFRDAEAALRRAQTCGDDYVFFSPTINATVAAHIGRDLELRYALERNEFVLHYQPKIDAFTERLSGVEALLRWQHPDRGLVMPNDFIPLLEKSGLIQRVGQRVIEMALEDYSLWESQGLHAPRIAVNVSPLQLRQPGFCRQHRAAAECLARRGAGA
jgi:diguanylate cyclase (GGDEF)-like protein/PAS domain S-box-containing protein